MVVGLVGVAWADACGYIGSGDWMNGASWTCSHVPGSSDTVRINWDNNTVTLAATAPDILSLEIGVDESGNLIVNAGGSLTMLGTSTVGNNGTCTGTLIVNAGGTVTSNDWLVVAGNSLVTGIVEVSGTLNLDSHLWCATQATSTAIIEINAGGVVNVGGMLGLGTINAVDPSGGVATLTVNDGSILNLSDIHPAGTSIQPGSVIDINGSGQLTLPGDFHLVIYDYIFAGLITGSGIPGNVIVDTTTNPGFTTVMNLAYVECIPPLMDLNFDCKIDLADYADLAAGWQSLYDIYNLRDLAEDWLLDCIQDPHNPMCELPSPM